MSLFKKILLSSLVGLVALGILTLFLSIRSLEKQGQNDLATIRTSLMVEKGNMTRSLVEVAWNVIEFASKRIDLSETEQRQLAISILRTMRYNSREYIWINTMDSVMIMHPVFPQLEGKNMAEFKDASGQLMFQKFINICRDKGEGEVRYFWQKPGEDTSSEKVSYVKAFTPWGWIIGTGIYVDDIDRMINQEAATINAGVANQRLQISLAIVGILAVTIAIVALISKRITLPIVRTGAILKDIAQGEGDLTKRLQVKSKDEVGQMAAWFDSFISKLHDIVKNISEYFEIVTASANQLMIISQQMDDGVHDMSGKSAEVATAAGEMSQNMHSIAAATEQAATNVRLVSQRVEIMNQMVVDIGESSDKARNITNRAVDETRLASEKISSLGQAAQEISKVTEAITEISDQTNLLALNATIEAARAGEAGKGFAVVANEIKELANQTARATKNIKEEIGTVQTRISETVADVGRIATVIGDVDQTVSHITTAVQAQAIAAGEMMANLQEASQGIDEVCRNVASTSAFSSEIAVKIDNVNTISQTIADNSTKVNHNASDLTRLATDLKNMIGGFKINQDEVAAAHVELKTTDLISWDESIRFGITIIDKQHHHLVDLVNKLYHAMRNRAAKAVLAEIFAELAQYTVEHFQHEEELMIKAKYADFENHKRAHEQLIKEVVTFKNEFEAGSTTVTLDLMNFLSDWLLNHIKKVDRRYVTSLSANQA